MPRFVHRFSLAISATVLVSLSGCSGDAPEVRMEAGRVFLPESLEVGSGTTVLFTNVSADSHTVTASELPPGADYWASGGAESEEEAREGLAEGLISKDGDYSVTLEVPGTYRYFCIPHEADGMMGTIVVSE